MLRYLLKPLTTFLILSIAFLQEPGSYFLYKNLILAGITFALLGDIFMMLSQNRFILGLISFSIAIILFTSSFAIDPGPYFGWGFFIPVVIYAIIFLLVFLKHSGKMKIPVVVYVALVGVFLVQASGRAWYLAEDGTLLALSGAILFVISDTGLAYHHFIKPYRLINIFYMSFYWIALLLISLSI